MWEIAFTILLIVLLGVIAVLYALRVARYGRAHSERVEKQGGSRLLSKNVMEIGYWLIQPVGDFLVHLKISAHALTVASFFFGLAAGASLAFGHFGSGGVFALIAAVLDALDGMVARLTGTQGKCGKILDSALDRYVEFFMLGGLIYYYRSVGWVLVIALLALVAGFMISYTTALAEIQKEELPRSSMKRPERLTYLILGVFLSPVSMRVFEAPSLYPVKLAYPTIAALCLIAWVGNASAFRRISYLFRTLRAKEAELEPSQEGSSKRRRESGAPLDRCTYVPAAAAQRRRSR